MRTLIEELRLTEAAWKKSKYRTSSSEPEAIRSLRNDGYTVRPLRGKPGRWEFKAAHKNASDSMLGDIVTGLAKKYPALDFAYGEKGWVDATLKGGNSFLSKIPQMLGKNGVVKKESAERLDIQLKAPSYSGALRSVGWMLADAEGDSVRITWWFSARNPKTKYANTASGNESHIGRVVKKLQAALDGEGRYMDVKGDDRYRNGP